MLKRQVEPFRCNLGKNDLCQSENDELPLVGKDQVGRGTANEELA